MAHHPQPWYTSSARDVPCSNRFHPSNEGPRMDDEESVSDVDEPPDKKIRFSRLHTTNHPTLPPASVHMKTPPLQRRAKCSLLTQALLTAPESTHGSDSGVPLLTSDGEVTSPTSTSNCSPPLANVIVSRLPSPAIKHSTNADSKPDANTMQSFHGNHNGERPREATVEARLGRPRCITFACGRQAASKTDQKPAASGEISNVMVSPNGPRLRFACPMKPSSGTDRKPERDTKPSEPLETANSTSQRHSMSISHVSRRRHQASGFIANNSKSNASADIEGSCYSQEPPVLGHTKLELFEATSFAEFARRFDLDDEWINEPTDSLTKLTVGDTLRKENSIRKLAEEAEAEALEEDGEQEAESLDNLAELDEDESASDDDSSDGGNESDNEEGFAESDDDSDHGSQYEFWTPGVTTAATSVDHMEHIRPLTQRFASDSSLGSVINPQESTAGYRAGTKHSREGQRTRKSPKMRPGTPDLPDGTDFVCGTFDEDRPREAAYMSCLEERRRSRHKIIPQDIDPSFPTSDPEAEEDEDGYENAISSDEHAWVMGRPDKSDDEPPIRKRKDLSRKMGKSPRPSPKRARSPAPRRGTLHRSPPPRKLFSQSPGRLRSTAVFHQKLNSPPSTRRTSFCIQPGKKAQGIAMSHLAQRPHLTHTTSLPRTPNPFWRQHHEVRDDCDPHQPSQAGSPSKADIHSRGPIEIVTGFENRRQRRKEKLWRQHCRYAGKEKERRCQPGKGAERMKELGLEMANRARDYGQKPVLVLSV